MGNFHLNLECNVFCGVWDFVLYEPNRICLSCHFKTCIQLLDIYYLFYANGYVGKIDQLCDVLFVFICQTNVAKEHVSFCIYI